MLLEFGIQQYNNLRELSSRLQTAVAPLKAKISLANKKINEKVNLNRSFIFRV